MAAKSMCFARRTSALVSDWKGKSWDGDTEVVEVDASLYFWLIIEMLLEAQRRSDCQC